MVPLENFSAHLRSISSADWDKLFHLIPGLERIKYNEPLLGVGLNENETFVLQMNIKNIVSKFENLVYQLELIPVFDWVSWKEGAIFIEVNNYDFGGLDTITICKLLTKIVRTDRFHENYLRSRIVDGTVLKLINALQKNVSIGLSDLLL